MEQKQNRCFFVSLLAKSYFLEIISITVIFLLGKILMPRAYAESMDLAQNEIIMMIDEAQKYNRSLITSGRGEAVFNTTMTPNSIESTAPIINEYTSTIVFDGDKVRWNNGENSYLNNLLNTQ